VAERAYPSSVALRVLVLILLVFGALTALSPTLAPRFAPAFLADRRLVAGVDLQGGAELVLEIHPRPVLDAEIAADAAWLAQRTGAAVDPFDDGFVITSERPASEVVRWVAPLPYRSAGREGDVHRFQLTDVWRARLEEHAIEEAVDWLRKRTECVPGSTVERLGGGLVAVALPGESLACP
jgi:preprotein translocase subunit SecD